MLALQLTLKSVAKQHNKTIKILNCIAFKSFSAATNNSLQPERTALYEFHLNNHGKLVNFAGFSLPVQYADLGIAASHIHTRKSSSIFDVSHMLQTYIRGKDTIQCFENICTADIKGLPQNSGSLTVFTNENGNILDDLIVTKISEKELYIVSNAAMKQQDMKIMEKAVANFKTLGKDVHIEFLSPENRSLIALQGPKSIDALQFFTKENLNNFYFMNSILTEIAGIRDCRITRCGYTGEDGFEISIPANKTQEIVENLLSYKNGDTVKLAGLGARDSLRLEAGLCLYGSDIDANISPIEASLSWLVGKRRRTEANFPGASIINEQIKNGVKRRRIGIRMISGPPARHDVDIYNLNGEKIGLVTSGCPSPSLGGNIAMGYVQEDFKKIGTKVQLKIRDKLFPAEISKMPFMSSKYYTKPKSS